MSIVEFKAVALGYGGNTVAENISFKINGGEYVCIVGENGSGKSTLLKAMLGLHPVVSGEIVYGDGLCHSEIGYLPQQTETQRDFPACVREVIISGCISGDKFRPFYTSADRKRAKWAMEQMEISSLAGKCYRELSGGQQQRVLIARALCAAKRLLVLDEPVSNLDPQMSGKMYCLLDRLRTKYGIAVVMITHDAHAVFHSDYVLNMGAESASYMTSADYMASDAGRRFMQRGGDRK